VRGVGILPLLIFFLYPNAKFICGDIFHVSLKSSKVFLLNFLLSYSLWHHFVLLSHASTHDSCVISWCVWWCALVRWWKLLFVLLFINMSNEKTRTRLFNATKLKDYMRREMCRNKRRLWCWACYFWWLEEEKKRNCEVVFCQIFKWRHDSQKDDEKNVNKESWLKLYFVAHRTKTENPTNYWPSSFHKVFSERESDFTASIGWIDRWK
jgi:hypothetical protein